MAITLTEKAAKHVSRYIERRGKGLGLRFGVRTTARFRWPPQRRTAARSEVAQTTKKIATQKISLAGA